MTLTGAVTGYKFDSLTRIYCTFWQSFFTSFS